MAKQNAAAAYADDSAHQRDLELFLEFVCAGQMEDALLLEDEMLLREQATAQKEILLPFAFICTAFDLSSAERFALLCAWMTNLGIEEAFALLYPDNRARAEALRGIVRNRAIMSLLLRWGKEEMPAHKLSLLPRVRLFLHDPFSGPFFRADVLWPGQNPPLLFATGIQKKLLRAVNAHPAEGGRAALLCLTGENGSGKRTQVACLADALHQPILAVDAREDIRARDIALECILIGALPCLLHAQALKEEDLPLIEELLTRFGIALLCSQQDIPRWMQECADVYTIPLERPNYAERLALWREMTKGCPLASVDLPALSGKFSMTPGQIEGAVRDVKTRIRMNGKGFVDNEMLHAACRRQVAVRLGPRVRRVEGSFAWDDLILPAAQKSLLRMAMDQVIHRQRVYGDWKLDRILPYGRGLSILLNGPPGTGKTMAAQVIARELMMDMYQVDLSGVVSKYVGDTERNLREIFDEMSATQGILFFDEADALFGKRTELKDAQDRYANMEASYLLQRIESYEGIVVLATNNYQNFDEAFRRRIKFVVDFPFPDAAQRMLIWQKVLPQTVPTSSVDTRFLSRFEISGSYIKNVAVNAAFLAAAEGCAVSMAHILRAMRTELNKAGKALLREDLGEYYNLVEDAKE